MTNLILNTPEEMFAFGQQLASWYKILLLQWELGAGKTTLIKWFAAGLGMDPQRVNSPTYTYIQEYQGSSEFRAQSLEDSGFRQNDGSRKLLHIDMYNIHSFDQLVQKWIAELVHDYEYIAIERPKFIDELWLEGTMIVIEKGEGDKRVIVIRG